MSRSSRRNLTREERTEVVSLFKNGMNISQIASQLEMSRRTVRTWVRRFEAGEDVQNHVRAWKITALNEEQITEVVNACKSNPCVSLKTFAQKFNVSTRTVMRALYKRGMQRKRFLKNGDNITILGDDANKETKASEYNAFDAVEVVYKDEVLSDEDGSS